MERGSKNEEGFIYTPKRQEYCVMVKIAGWSDRLDLKLT